MALTTGVLSQNSVSWNAAVVSSTAATGGTGPYTYQWYRSTTTGFTPGGGNILAGATELTFSDSNLIPNTTYYYKVVSTDTGNSNVTVTSLQLTVVTAAQGLSQNQFQQSMIAGAIDMRFPYDTISVQIHSTQVGNLYPGSAVKIVDETGGVPKVVGVAADADEVFGYINFDAKTAAFTAGTMAEISQDGNVIFLYATNAIARGAQCALEYSADGAGANGVKALTGSSGANIVGYAIDKATNPGDLIRVKLACPSFLVD